MAKIKVLLIAHSFVVPRYREGVAKELAKNKDYEIKVFCPDKFPMLVGKTYLFEQGKKEDYDVLTGKTLFGKKSSFMIYTSGLKDIINHWQPDIIDIFDEAPWAWNVAQITNYRNRFSPKTKVALFVDNNIDRKWSGLHFFYKYVENYTISNADRVYVPIENSGFEKIVRAGGYKGKISYIPGTMDVSLFKPRTGVKIEKLKKELGIKKNDFIIGIVGGLGKYKGYYPKGTPAVIKACARLPENVKLLLVGAGNKDNLAELKSLASSLGMSSDRIITTEFIPFEKMPFYYNVMSVVAAMSVPRSDWAEPCGRMQLEGMASGIPVIASDCGSNKAIVSKSGFVCAVDDDEAFAKYTKKLMSDKDLYKKMSLAGIKNAINNFSTENVAKKRDKMYKEITH